MISKTIRYAFAIIFFLSILQSCIKNDLPYPRIQEDILSLSAVGELAPANIDTRNMSVTFSLDETTDIYAVKFKDFKISEGATSSLNLLDGTYDLSVPLKVTLSRYQDYEWTITAVQYIERYLTIEGQVGETVIDVPGRRILVKVPESMDLSKLTLTSIKLGPEGETSMIPDLTPGIVDFSKPLEVMVTAWGRSAIWRIYVEKTESLVTTVSADAWSEIIWVYGEASAEADKGFQYRLASESVWNDVPDSYVTINEGSFSCYIPHLLPLTEYVVRAVSGENVGESITVKTEATEILPDGSFDQWWLNGKIWCPWNEGGVQFWDTGNTGAATLGQSNVTPSDYVPNGMTGQSAKLETKFIGFGSLGKLGAGSIYTGKFVRVDGTNGILDFGRPWNFRPTKLRGYFQYSTAPINYASDELKSMLGRPDTCHIYIALTDWTAPYEIRTNPKNRHLFDKNSEAVIAYGELQRGSNTNGYEQFEIVLNYRSTSRKPSYIQITCAASKYGDFFTGGAEAVLYVDEFSLSYDY